MSHSFRFTSIIYIIHVIYVYAGTECVCPVDPVFLNHEHVNVIYAIDIKHGTIDEHFAFYIANCFLS